MSIAALKVGSLAFNRGRAVVAALQPFDPRRNFLV